jgi:hypothetical protein
MEFDRLVVRINMIRVSVFTKARESVLSPLVTANSPSTYVVSHTTHTQGCVSLYKRKQLQVELPCRNICIFTELNEVPFDVWANIKQAIQAQILVLIL